MTGAFSNVRCRL